MAELSTLSPSYLYTGDQGSLGLDERKGAIDEQTPGRGGSNECANAEGHGQNAGENEGCSRKEVSSRFEGKEKSFQLAPADPTTSAVQKQKKRIEEATMMAPANSAKPRKDTTGKMERRTRTDAKSCKVHQHRPKFRMMSDPGSA